LWPDWRYHAFVTDRPGTAVELDADHRRHAMVELAIRDLKQGAGLRHCPSGKFLANAAWAVIATLAHNLLRWTATLGLAIPGLVVAKTLRHLGFDVFTSTPIR
jgi:Transposase DDE domain